MVAPTACANAASQIREPGPGMARYAAVSNRWWLACQDHPMAQGFFHTRFPAKAPGEAAAKHRAVPT